MALGRTLLKVPQLLRVEKRKAVVLWFFLVKSKDAIYKVAGTYLNRYFFLIAAGQILADYNVNKKITHKKFNIILFYQKLR